MRSTSSFAAFVPAIVIPGAIFTVVFAWPWIDARFITGDHREHHINQRPRDVPVRSAIGIAGLTFLAVIFVAGSNDVVASQLGVGLQTVTAWLRVAAFVLSALAGWLSLRVLRGLATRPDPARTRRPAHQARGTS